MAAVKSEFYLSTVTEFIASLSNNSTTNYSIYTTSISAAISSPVVLTLLILVVCVYKAYKTTLQRLILYHIIFSLLCELLQILVITLKFSFPLWTCATIIYLSLYTVQSWVVYTIVVTNCLFIITLRLIRGNTRMWRYGKVTECICVCSALVSPIAYFWVTILDGYHVALCKGIHPSTVTRIGILLATIYAAASVEILFVSIIVCSFFCVLQRQIQSRPLSNLLKRLLCYTIACTVFTIFSAFSITSLFFKYPLETFSVKIEVISGVFPFIVLASTIVLSSLAIRPNCKHLCCNVSDHKRYQMDENVNESQGATNPTSRPMNQPSRTYFSIPYTGAFTQVTVNEHNEERGVRAS